MIFTTHLHRTKTWLRFGAAMLIAFAGASSTAFAARYIPASDDTVLLTLNAPTPRVSSDSSDPSTAARHAQELIDLGRSLHDERYFGYASAALRAWSGDAAPIPIAILRADIAQHQHRFKDALTLLDGVIVRDAHHARARLMRASLHMAQGQPQLARRDCQRLFSAGESFAATVCIAQATSLNGQLDVAYRLLTELLSTTRDGGERHAWALGVAAEMSERRGDLNSAEVWLRKALALSPNDLASQLQLTDVLLKRGQPELAIAILHGTPASEPVLLRRALAAKQMGDQAQAEAALSAWQSAVNESRRIGSTLHLRELAQGQLDLLADSRAALATALDNWQVQREPVDARLLAAAAIAANDPGTVELVRAWRETLDIEDKGLTL